MKIASLCVLATCAFFAGCGDGSSSATAPIVQPAAVPPCLESMVRPGELAASPRSDPTVEWLAQHLSAGLTADQPIYDRLMRDRASIAGGWPEVARAFNFGRKYSEEILVRANAASTNDAMLAGTYAEWNCLNSALSAAVDRPFSGGVVVKFSGPLLTLERVSRLYAALPGVSYAEPNYIVTIVSLAWTDTGVTPVGDVWHYVLWQPWYCPDCAPEGYYYFTTFAGGGVTFVDSRLPADNRPEPGWLETYWRQAQSRRPLPP